MIIIIIIIIIIITTTILIIITSFCSVGRLFSWDHIRARSLKLHRYRMRTDLKQPFFFSAVIATLFCE